MIKTENEYKKSVEQLKLYNNNLSKQKESLETQGFSSVEIERLLQPSISFVKEMEYEINYYEKLCQQNIMPEFDFENIGKFLIALRIYKGLTQTELSKQLGVTPAQVSKDESNEYYNATLTKINKLLKVLEAKITINYTMLESSRAQSIEQ